MYIRIWEFTVKPEKLSKFELAYGPTGDWVQLFRKHEAFIKTELHRNLAGPNRYITVDYFTSEAGFEKFKELFHSEYKTLDRRLEDLTISERSIGNFEAITPPRVTQ
jgi:hypothetical protein